MSIERVFHSLESFSRFLERAAVTAEIPMVIAARESARVLQKNIKNVYGKGYKFEHNLAGSGDLAPSTQAERTALNYTPNDPLLRDGRLLRDNVERFSEPGIAASGTPEIINAYHEFGYLSFRSGKSVPPRPTFKIGLQDSEAEVIEIVELACGSILGFSPIATVIREGY